MTDTTRTAASRASTRREIIDLLNDALSHEYHSFVGHAIGSNPYVKPEWEADLRMLEELRDEENANTRALLVQLGRYRAGPTLRAFHLWKEDLNFLSLEWLVIRAADEAKKEIARVETLLERVPADDVELNATFASLMQTKRAHAERLATAAAKRVKERDARRAQHHAATAVKVSGLGAPKAAAPAKSSAAPSKPSTGAPKLPGGFKLPPGGGPPSPPKPQGAPKPPGAPSPPAAPQAPKKSLGWPPLPPGFQLPPRR